MGDLGKLILAKGFKNLSKVQEIAQSGHTGWLVRKKFYSSQILITQVSKLIESGLMDSGHMRHPIETINDAKPRNQSVQTSFSLTLALGL